MAALAAAKPMLGQLPRALVPNHVDVSIDVDYKFKRFHGLCATSLECHAATKEIKFNCVGITFSSGSLSVKSTASTPYARIDFESSKIYTRPA